MPRIREVEETPVTDTPVDPGTPEAALAASGEAPAKRERRPVPATVTGLLDAPVAVEAPPTAATGGRRGKPVNQATLNTIAQLKANPGSWFKLGTFMSNQAPTKDSALGREGFTFKHTRNDDGTFDRYACLEVATPEG